MPRKASGNFNQIDYIHDWSKKNMKRVSADYAATFVDEFKSACQKLGVKQSDVIRQAMLDTIEKAKAVG